MEKRLSLNGFGDGEHLWTRELAGEIKAEGLQIMNELEPGDALVIDALGVKVFDFSFANELFGKILINVPRQYPGRFCIVENLTTYTCENLGKALESLNLAMIERKGKELHLIGKFHSTDQETFQAIAKAKGWITAATLSDMLGVNLTAMNERLSKLTNQGLVQREKATSAAGREHYQYRTLD